MEDVGMDAHLGQSLQTHYMGFKSLEDLKEVRRGVGSTWAVGLKKLVNSGRRKGQAGDQEATM
jgi:hypothetical protein